MKNILIKPARKLSGRIKLPGDKSISHRVVIIGSISRGRIVVKNFLPGEDCLHTLNAFKQLGVDIERQDNTLVIKGKGLKGLNPPKNKTIYLGNSGTSMRLMAGVLAAQSFETILTGDKSLSSRPMKRIIEPLRLMGANIQGSNASKPPLYIKPAELGGISYHLPVASAQVKSCILLAGLYTKEKTKIIEPVKTRDHTERLLKLFQANLKIKGLKVTLTGNGELGCETIEIPGDISSASFFIIAGCLIKNSHLVVKSVGLNPTRTGICNILKMMKAKIKVVSNDKLVSKNAWEPYGDMEISSSTLKPIHIKKNMVAKIIDELPIIMVACCVAKGTSIIEGASELRVKETDRIFSMSRNLKKMGAKIKVKKDDIIIEGVGELYPAEVESFGDHRTAISMIIAGLASKNGETLVKNIDCIKTSFPNFLDILNQIGAEFQVSGVRC